MFREGWGIVLAFICERKKNSHISSDLRIVFLYGDLARTFFLGGSYDFDGGQKIVYKTLVSIVVVAPFLSV